MALTVNTNPANIDNSGLFNVTSSLVEDTTHVNMRIRADITVSSIIVATLEKPISLSDFDFSEILAAEVPGISFARNSGAVYNTTGGSPLVAYTILFTEVWEYLGVTTTGDTDNASGTTYKYVPAKGDPDLSFSNFVLTGSVSRFANTTLRNNVCKFYSFNPMEYWVVFFTEQTALSVKWNKDGSTNGFIDFTASNGWGTIIINSGQLMSGVVSYLEISIYAQNHTTQYSEALRIYLDAVQISERVVLEYDGLLGGKEYLPFEGLKDLEFNTIRNYFTGIKKNKKPVAFFGVNKQVIETRFKDMYNADYLKSLLISNNVKKLNSDYTVPEVTLTTENIVTGSNDLFKNQLTMEYEY
jgi:hypothetical protein